jgi:hypothetical protein
MQYTFRVRRKRSKIHKVNKYTKLLGDGGQNVRVIFCYTGLLKMENSLHIRIHLFASVDFR